MASQLRLLQDSMPLKQSMTCPAVIRSLLKTIPIALKTVSNFIKPYELNFMLKRIVGLTPPSGSDVMAAVFLYQMIETDNLEKTAGIQELSQFLFRCILLICVTL